MPDVAPDPTALTARICTWYAVLFTSAGVPLVDCVVMTNGLVADAGDIATKVVPLSVEYS